MTKDEMLEKYNVLGFAYYMCVVERKSDGVRGTLDFADDQEYDNDYARRDVPVFTQCKTLHDGTDGIKRNTKSSKGNKKPSKGSTETLPF